MDIPALIEQARRFQARGGALAFKLKALVFVVAVCSGVGLGVVHAMSAAQGAAPVTDIRSALLWIIAGGASIVGSWVVDRVKAFDGLDTGLRMGAVLAFSLVLTTVARLLVQFVPAEVFTFVDIYFKDWLPYITGALAMFATKAVRTGFAKAKTLTAIGTSPYSS